MSLNETTLTTAISAAVFSNLETLLVAKGTVPTPLSEVLSGVVDAAGTTGTVLLQSFCDKIAAGVASAIIAQLTATADITVTMATHTHTGVTTGPGISGPPVVGVTAIEYGKPDVLPTPTGGIT